MAHPHSVFQVIRRPRAELLTVGTELLTGTVLNTNAQFLSRELTSLGIRMTHQTSCHDEKRAIQEALGRALLRSEIVVVTGGLGPTPDDVTREALADFFGRTLVLSRPQWRRVQKYYRAKGQLVPAMVKQEACFPHHARPLLNRFGIALGFIVESCGRLVVALPGVPGELTRLFQFQVAPYLRRRFPKLVPRRALIAKIAGLSEPTVMKRLGKDFFKQGTFQFGIYPEVGEVTLRIYADSKAFLARLRRSIERTLGRDVYAYDEKPLESVIGKLLLKKRYSFAVAESCTGGQIAERITRISGASRYFAGGVVAYADSVKVGTLGVSKEALREGGAVSIRVVRAMAEGVRHRFGTKLGLAITGIAGPGGGSRKKPVGRVYIAISSGKRSAVWNEFFRGDRIQIQDRAVKKALEHLWRWVKG